MIPLGVAAYAGLIAWLVLVQLYAIAVLLIAAIVIFLLRF